MRSKKDSPFFSDGISYINVYFMKIDASGHSNIVLKNSDDLVNKLFDLLEQTVYSAVEDNRKIHDCQYAEFWGWQGDGGLCVIYDPCESIALRTSIESATHILDYKMKELRNHLSKLKIKGDLHLRISIHKGNFTYKGHTNRGSIHSKDLNFVSHLETRTPKDSLTISKDVFDCCDTNFTDKFELLDFDFEDRKIFIYNPNLSNKTYFEWLNNISFHNSFKANVFPQRLSESEKANFIRHAKCEVIDLGTASRTCSYYLGSTQRPRYYRDQVLELLDRGVNYTCLLLNPDSEIMDVYSKLRGESLKERTIESLQRFESFAREAKDKKGHFKIYLYSQLPYFACISVDGKDNGSLIFSPYMPNFENLKIERADIMHFLISKEQGINVYDQITNCINAYLEDRSTIEYEFH